MIRRLGLCSASLVVVLMLVVLAVGAVTSAATTPRAYRPGRYSGGIAVDPASGYGGRLAFTVDDGTISRLTARERGMICIAPSQGGGVEGSADYVLKVPKSWQVRIGREGEFSFAGTLRGKHHPRLTFRGRVRGRVGSGKIAFGFNQSPGVTCSMSEAIRFRARL